MTRQTTPDLFPVVEDLNARYQGKRVRASDNCGRVAVGTFARCEEQHHTNGHRPLAILVDYETLHHDGMLMLSAESKDPMFPWVVFYLADNPTVEVLGEGEASADA